MLPDFKVDGQLEIVQQLIDNRQSMFVLHPTGSGKTLFATLSALFLPEITLLICPMIALIEDHAYHLQRINVILNNLVPSTR